MPNAHLSSLTLQQLREHYASIYHRRRPYTVGAAVPRRLRFAERAKEIDRQEGPEGKSEEGAGGGDAETDDDLIGAGRDIAGEETEQGV